MCHGGRVWEPLHVWGSWNAGFRLGIRFSHQKEEAGAMCLGVLACGQKSEGWPGAGAGGELLTVDLDELGKVGEEPGQLLSGQQALLLHPLVEDQVQDPECAQMGRFGHEQL